MDSQTERTESFLRLLNNPFKFRIFLFFKLPSAFFSGLRIKEIDGSHSVVTVPYKWFTKNPFRSTYFACLGMAAEMSSGVMALAHSYKHDPPLSMLVVKLEANYFKKATGLTRFLCSDGAQIQNAIQLAISSGEGQQCRVRSVGLNEAGEEIAEFIITWSFKVRSARIKPV